ncbi:hypothetical protein PF010_g24517 [Phytophthora fragariae]|uniref:Uncharacterized protein n=1 Tax=Phytophthora fragariae TaxID=53985 RepID=A0A6G0K2A9_9STRA|nr:hypothetical protein PF010_g24517 [Phytophthora fragariae]KAE9293794.1 hypothetical protein PF008_g24709 [Phytophthora fragariae]
MAHRLELWWLLLDKCLAKQTAFYKKHGGYPYSASKSHINIIRDYFTCL